MAERRRGRWFDPALVDALLRICRDPAFWRGLEDPDVSGWEPTDRLLVADDDRLDRIAEAFARVIDAKSPFTARHSERVAEIAVGVGDLLGSTRSRAATCAAPGCCTTSASSPSPT